MLEFRLLYRDAGSRARVGVLATLHGPVETPAFLPLGTRATVRSLLPDDLVRLGAQIVLANTYHLYLQPGADTIAHLGGLHRFMAWPRAILTDSGGFQVFSLGAGWDAERVKGSGGNAAERDSPSVVKISEGGVTFKSHLDGSLHEFTPEKAMEVQHKLGADIILALDECTAYEASYEYTREAMGRTHRWARRCLEAHAKRQAAARPALFGIVQGGLHQDLREESAQFIAGLPFDGYAIGGPIVRDPHELQRIVGWVVPPLPQERPRHLLGIGDIENLVACVGLGIDMFDCALPTRMARHGALLVPDRGARWRMNIANAAYARDDQPIDATCPCDTCRQFTRAYLHHLFRAQEITALRLATLHNLAFILGLMREIRQSITEGRFAAFRREFLGPESCP